MALEHAQKAVYFAQEELAFLTEGAGPSPNIRHQSQLVSPEQQHQKITTLAVAYYNLAVELEHTHFLDQSLQVGR